MRNETIQIYKYKELDHSTQCRVRDYFALNIVDYPWFDEAIESIKVFCSVFNVNIQDYRIDPEDYRGSFIKTDADNLNFRGYKLRDAKKLKDTEGNGYYIYCGMVEYFHDQFKALGDAKEAFNDTLWSATKWIESDIEYQYSKEAIEEMSESNAYEFTKDGKIYH